MNKRIQELADKAIEGMPGARGDDAFFKWIYTNHREYNNVKDSVWKTLSYLYGDYVADLLEFQ